MKVEIPVYGDDEEVLCAHIYFSTYTYSSCGGMSWYTSLNISFHSGLRTFSALANDCNTFKTFKINI
jgi:hypothetical protein